MTRTTGILVIAGTALVSAAATLFAYRALQDEASEPGGRAEELRSTVLGERRNYLVYLPEGYEKEAEARYPVLYVLEAESQAGHTAETASLLARIGVIPPMIVVGIPNLSDDTRARDFTPPDRWRSPSGGAGGFLSFLQTELIPSIEKEYRTVRPRMLAGWSRTGMFVLYSQIAAPSLFDARFAHSPFVWSPEDEPAATRFEAELGAASQAPGFLYLSRGDQEEQTKAPFDHAVRALEKGAPPSLRWRADVSGGAGHERNPVLSAPVALCEAFAPANGRMCRPLQR